MGFQARRKAALRLGVALSVFCVPGMAFATDTVIQDGQTATTTQTLPADGDTLTVQSGGTISTGVLFGVVMAAANQTTTVEEGGTISTASDLAYAIYSAGFGAVITNAGKINTTGDGGFGIYARLASNAIIINSGMISTTGAAAYGIWSTGSDAIITNSGMIKTTGGGAFGIISQGTSAVITNAGTILATNPGASAVLMAGTNATLNLLAGSAIQGGIWFINPGSASLNIGRWQNTALTLTGVPATISTSGQPYVLSGSVLAVVDPTGFAAGSAFAIDLTRSIANTLDTRMAPGTGDTMMATGAISSATASAHGWDYWASVNGFYGDRSASGSSDGFHYGAGNLMAGADTSLSATDRAGFFAGLSAGQMKTASGTTRIDATGGFGGVYWGRDTGSMFTNASLTAGGLSNSSDRTVANNMVAGGLEDARADYTSWFISPALTVGMHSQVMGHAITPSVRIRYSGLYQDGYSETGSAANMTVSGRTSNAVDLRGQVRTNVSTAMNADGVTRVDVRTGVDGIFNWGDKVDAQLLGTAISFDTGAKNSVARGFIGTDVSFAKTNGLELNGTAELGYDSNDTLTLTAGITLHRTF
jgi:uncharacterized protein with beta-barrel porin domain